MTAPIPPHVGPDIFGWARDFSNWTRRALSQLTFKPSDASAIENGTILWDEASGYPVVSKGGNWRQMVLEGGHFYGVVASSQTAASANTPYALTYTAQTSSGIANGTPASRIVFDEAGEYMVSFSVEISSSSSSTVNFSFWPSINGSDVAFSTMRSALHQNGAVLVLSRSSIFTVSADDYLEIRWSVDNTSGRLSSAASGYPAPSAPASTIGITRIHG